MIDVVPAFLVVAARRVVVDADDVRDVLVELGIQLRLEDVVERGLLALFLGLERLRIVEHFAVAVAQDVGRVPAAHAEHARLEAGRDHRLDQRLSGLHVVAGHRRFGLRRQFQHGRDVGRQVGRGVGERDALLERGVGVDHARRNRIVARLEPLLEGSQRLMHRAFLHEDFRAAAPHHHEAAAAVLLLEGADVGNELLGEVLLVLALLDVRVRSGASRSADRTPPTWA